MGKINTLKTGYACAFSEPPRIGTSIDYWGGRTATLIAVDPYIRKDGGNSFLLKWKLDTGRIGVSGMKSKAMTWVKP